MTGSFVSRRSGTNLDSNIARTPVFLRKIPEKICADYSRIYGIWKAECHVLTRRKFRVKFPGGPVPNPSTIRRQAKWFKETGSVKNRKVNHRRHVLIEETLDEIGERLKHTLQKPLKVYHRKLEYLCRLYKEQQNYWNWSHIKFQLWIYTGSHNENSCLGMSQFAIITITTITALTSNNNHNQ